MISKYIFVPLTLLAAAPLAARSAHPVRSAGDPRQTLQAYYRDMDEGYAEHDLSRAYQYYSDDYVSTGTDPDDKVVLDDLKGSMGQLFNDCRLIRSTTTIASMVPQARGYLVSVRQHLLFKGISINTGQLSQLDAFILEKDYWQKAPEGWRLVRSRLVSGRGLWDGHKITADDIPGGNGNGSGGTLPSAPDDGGASG